VTQVDEAGSTPHPAVKRTVSADRAVTVEYRERGRTLRWLLFGLLPLGFLVWSNRRQGSYATCLVSTHGTQVVGRVPSHEVVADRFVDELNRALRDVRRVALEVSPEIELIASPAPPEPVAARDPIVVHWSYRGFTWYLLSLSGPRPRTPNPTPDTPVIRKLPSRHAWKGARASFTTSVTFTERTG
jgi:hypothetical protein